MKADAEAVLGELPVGIALGPRRGLRRVGRRRCAARQPEQGSTRDHGQCPAVHGNSPQLPSHSNADSPAFPPCTCSLLITEQSVINIDRMSQPLSSPHSRPLDPPQAGAPERNPRCRAEGVRGEGFCRRAHGRHRQTRRRDQGHDLSLLREQGSGVQVAGARHHRHDPRQRDRERARLPGLGEGSAALRTRRDGDIC